MPNSVLAAFGFYAFLIAFIIWMAWAAERERKKDDEEQDRLWKDYLDREKDRWS